MTLEQAKKLVTEEKPYIQFEFNDKGKLKFSISSNSWGKGGYSGYDDDDKNTLIYGNTCLPKYLKRSIQSLKAHRVKAIQKEILLLQKEIEKVKSWTNI